MIALMTDLTDYGEIFSRYGNEWWEINVDTMSSSGFYLMTGNSRIDQNRISWDYVVKAVDDERDNVFMCSECGTFLSSKVKCPNACGGSIKPFRHSISSDAVLPLLNMVSFEGEANF